MKSPNAAAKTGSEVPRSSLPWLVFVACGVAFWDFVFIFRGWVVASQAEVVGVTIFFFFLGVLPWFGIIGAARRQIWGPRLMISSALISATGFFFIKLEEWEVVPVILLLAIAPMIGVGLALKRCITTDHAARSPKS